MIEAVKAWTRPFRHELRWQVLRPYRYWRKWRNGVECPVPDAVQLGFYRGVLGYTYLGVACLRHPVDLAIYLLIFQELKPATVIEVGSRDGGGAMLYGDLLKMLGIPARVYSIDLKRADPPYRPDNVVFLQGDESDFGKVDLAWAELPKPWLVINDASHCYGAIMDCLSFVERYMVKGDRLIVEDGWLSQLGMDGDRAGGPRRAIAEFVASHPDWQIERRYCDFFGRNITANPDGYLVKT